MRELIYSSSVLIASPALAASGPFVSLRNTDFIVLLAFIAFIGVLVYFKVPSLIGGMLDKRANTIRNELDEARKLREEAQSIFASYERRQKEIEEQAERIVESARKEAEAEAEKARAALDVTVSRRLAAAEEQIASAQASAEREVRDKAVTVAVAAAKSVLSTQMSASMAKGLIEESIKDVETKLH